jgi:hypothetical protein
MPAKKYYYLGGYLLSKFVLKNFPTLYPSLRQISVLNLRVE